MPDHIYQRMSRRLIGKAPIPILMIDGHAECRVRNNDHLEALRLDIAKDPESRWANPIDVVLGEDIDARWLTELNDNRLCDSPPPSGHFWCISGHHRLMAALLILDKWNPTGEEVDPRVTHWPANVYESGPFFPSPFVRPSLTVKKTQRR